MSGTVRDDLERMLAAFVAAYPTPYPVRLRVVKRLRDDDGNECYGLCWREGRSIRIEIDAALLSHRWAARTVLAHEYAHALDVRHERVERRRGHHTDEWGLNVARLERLRTGEA